MNLRRFRNGLIDHYKHRYITYPEALLSLYRTRKNRYTKLSTSELKLHKSSDTIFILGSGPSLNSLSLEQINHIKKHDSFGINYSFFKREIIPTYHSFGWHKGRYNRWKVLFSPFRERYKDVVVMMHTKALYSRLVHPRFIPILFPIDPIIFLYTIPESIILKEERMITDEEFNKSLLYRGSLSLALDLVVRMGYIRIVLLGVDLDTNKHFWYQYSEMQPDKIMHEEAYKNMNSESRFESQITKPNKMLSFDKYLFYISRDLKKVRGISLYSGFNNRILSDFLPSYFTLIYFSLNNIEFRLVLNTLIASIN